MDVKHGLCRWESTTNVVTATSRTREEADVPFAKVLLGGETLHARKKFFGSDGISSFSLASGFEGSPSACPGQVIVMAAIEWKRVVKPRQKL